MKEYNLNLNNKYILYLGIQKYTAIVCTINYIYIKDVLHLILLVVLSIDEGLRHCSSEAASVPVEGRVRVVERAVGVLLIHRQH